MVNFLVSNLGVVLLQVPFSAISSYAGRKVTHNSFIDSFVWRFIRLFNIHLISIHPISIHYPSIIHPSNIHQSIHSYIQFIYLQMGVWWLWLPTLCISWIHFWSWLNLFILLDDIRVSYAHSSFRLLRYPKHLWWIVRGCGISNLIIPFCQQTTITRKV